MSQALPIPGNCDESCSTPSNIGPPGVPGADGAPGDPGDDGANAWALTTGDFAMPAELGSVTIGVNNAAWAAIGQILFVGGGGAGGYFKLTNKPTNTSMTLQNLEDAATSAYTSNSPPTTNFPAGSTVSAGGLQGPTGSNPSGALININNLNDVSNVATARTNLGLGTAALQNVGFFLQVANNLSDLANVITARLNLGLVKGVANTNTPQVDDAAGLVNGEFLRATAAGIESITAAIAITGLGLSRSTVGVAAMSERISDTNTPGGFTSGSWVTRVLNDEGVDPDSLVVLNGATGEFTLIAGTYELFAHAPAYKVDRHQVRLFNVTDATVIIWGFAAHAPAANDAETISHLYVRFTLASTKTLRLEHQCETTNATDGRGKAMAFGSTNNHYAYLYLRKEAG